MTELDASGRGFAVRNSVSLGVFIAIAADARVSFTVVELAGRGITADATASRWALEAGKPSLDGFTLADRLIEFGEWEERLAGLWQAYGRGEVETTDFEAQLAQIVTAMERWP
ncbi:MULTISPECIES: hypothetical protein [unclassified Streptomyces]|uniref:hypothetical protein n=1 Tax=unclassified Streptomyces TaxID=2593676 RepID=UPI002DDA3C69|nr:MULTISPECIES: hypothetical protein [unclassified Streptomyces]WSA95072.1 hypothetical protein OIE63_28605 [Streptomyces sp. NBC_01795]WSB79492.1 hypothetical protein OHB04_29720 [Streptomyces sp. NBC_01775]WSS12303.1 hypothetical protein OG533_10495 [Streptomyces sp. NBC_01186]WSS41016.1 hypothetical protein OG220_10650 [Streptomyces sp. NBC_01187]